jgi:mRNA-degrading endonuclease HigB of HigAB toxin-antitoxin module
VASRIEGGHPLSISAVKRTFPATDYASETQTLIFDIGGNKYRLIAHVDFAE